MACQLIYPINQILFVDQACYTYKRWHMLGWIAGHVGKYREGKMACLKAIEARNEEVDRGNLKLYLERELECLQGGQLVCPILMSATVLDRETRTREESSKNHDSGKICEEIVNEIISSNMNNKKNIFPQIVNQFKIINKNLEKSESLEEKVLIRQNDHRQTRQEKRAELREKLKEKRKAKAGK
jgi:hypothetical protein